jgi:hypothetical protein
LRPPGIKENWDDNHVLAQADLIGFEHVRSHDEAELRKELYQASGAKVF